MIPHAEWRWFGDVGHFICGQWCRFHLCTQVGDYLVSTVGRYVHPRHSAGSEQAEREWLQKHPDGEEVGFGRFYVRLRRPSGNRRSPVPTRPPSAARIRIRAQSTASPPGRPSSRGHMEMCERWAASPAPEVQPA